LLDSHSARRFAPAALILAAAAVPAMCAGILIGEEHVFRGGLLAFLIGCFTLIALRTGADAALLERARQAGYDAGYHDGRTVGKPVVVRLPSADAALLALGGTTRELGEDKVLGRTREHSL
jgi:hypothetical protein